MKYTCLVIALFVASASCQRGGGPPPPPPPSADPGYDAGSKPSPVVTLSQAPDQTASQPQPPAEQPSGVPVSAPAYRTSQRPQGCSPGCYSEEICAEMGRSYCSAGGQCYVCIKMSSIRFPASALSGMFPSVASPPVVAAPQTPVQMPMGQMGQQMGQMGQQMGQMGQQQAAGQQQGQGGMFPFLFMGDFMGGLFGM